MVAISSFAFAVDLPWSSRIGCRNESGSHPDTETLDLLVTTAFGREVLPERNNVVKCWGRKLLIMRKTKRQQNRIDGWNGRKQPLEDLRFRPCTIVSLASIILLSCCTVCMIVAPSRVLRTPSSSIKKFAPSLVCHWFGRVALYCEPPALTARFRFRSYGIRIAYSTTSRVELLRNELSS